ncbi:MAG: hypothetical protein ACLR6J_08585 [Parabacteroides merdae]
MEVIQNVFSHFAREHDNPSAMFPKQIGMICCRPAFLIFIGARCSCLIVPFLLVQLSSILLPARRSQVTLIRNVRVHLLSKPAGPFLFPAGSFCIPTAIPEKEVDEILCTGVRMSASGIRLT